MNKVIAGIAASSLLGLSLLFAVPANATGDGTTPVCTIVEVTPAVPAVPAVPAIPAVEEVSHMEKGELITPAVEAVPSQWWNFSPNNNKGKFEGPPAFPNDERGTWQGPHTNGGPDKEKTGTFQNGQGNGSWFHRKPAVEAKEAVYGPNKKVVTVEAVPGVPAVEAVPAVSAVTKEECTAETPVEPEPTTPPTDAPHVFETAPPANPHKGETPEPSATATASVVAPVKVSTPPSVDAQQTQNRGVNIDTGATASTEKLATTGADNTGLAVLGILMLLLGLILLVPKAFSTRNH